MKILCVPAALLDRLGITGKFTPVKMKRFHGLLAPEQAAWIEEEEAEENPEFRQIIPYMLVRNVAGDYFGYRRTKKKTGEPRLRDKVSIGVGGHVEEKDMVFPASVQRVVEAARARELVEELGVPPAAVESCDCIGFLRDDDSEVGRVHVGLLYVVRIGNYEIKPNVEEGLEPITPVADDERPKLWFHPDEFVSNHELFNSLEPWSQMVLRYFLTKTGDAPIGPALSMPSSAADANAEADDHNQDEDSWEYDEDEDDEDDMDDGLTDDPDERDPSPDPEEFDRPNAKE
jgi:predicted NUDIX family phosphoesterase